MKLLITDNEIHIRSAVKELLLAFCPQITEIAEASGVKEGLAMIKSYQPDILLLDVEMDDGTGFDLMRQVTDPQFQLIFITAHNKYAVDAFKFSAIDYLLKPVDPDELSKAIGRAMANHRNADFADQLAVLMDTLSSKMDTNKRLVLKDSGTTYFIKIADILYCEADGPYTRFYVSPDKSITVCHNLKEYENILEPLGFLRTHHSYLVNPHKIISYDRKDTGSLMLEGNHQVPLSQRKKDQILHALEGKA
jgi:two-component system, LytTR family, response regulator